MGRFNILTFGRKMRTSTNALLASYTFLKLGAAEQNLVMHEAKTIAPHWFLGEWQEKITNLRERIVFLNLLACGMMARGIVPAIPGEPWMNVNNPFVESIGAEEVIGMVKDQFEAKYGVEFDLGE